MSNSKTKKATERRRELAKGFGWRCWYCGVRISANMDLNGIRQAIRDELGDQNWKPTNQKKEN